MSWLTEIARGFGARLNEDDALKCVTKYLVKNYGYLGEARNEAIGRWIRENAKERFLREPEEVAEEAYKATSRSCGSYSFQTPSSSPRLTFPENSRLEPWKEYPDRSKREAEEFVRQCEKIQEITRKPEAKEKPTFSENSGMEIKAPSMGQHPSREPFASIELPSFLQLEQWKEEQAQREKEANEKLTRWAEEKEEKRRQKQEEMKKIFSPLCPAREREIKETLAMSALRSDPDVYFCLECGKGRCIDSHQAMMEGVHKSSLQPNLETFCSNCKGGKEKVVFVKANVYVEWKWQQSRKEVPENISLKDFFYKHFREDFSGLTSSMIGEMKVVINEKVERLLGKK